MSAFFPPSVTPTFSIWNINFSTLSSVLGQMQEPISCHKLIAPKFIIKSVYAQLFIAAPRLFSFNMNIYLVY